MKRVLTSSLLTAEIAAFAMLMLLFFMNTSRPYLLLIPIAGVAGGYFLFKVFERKSRDKGAGKAVPLAIAFAILLGIIVAALVIGLVYVLNA